MERPNHTIYINNLNEKVKKDGKILFYPVKKTDFDFIFQI